MAIDSDDASNASSDPARTSLHVVNDGSPSQSSGDRPPAPEGTVDATITTHDPHFYGARSEMLTGTPPRQAAPAAGDAGKTRTSELIEELQAISDQINQIMTQVDRAVARLATG